MQLAVSTSWKYKSYLKLKILKGNTQLLHRTGNSKCFGGVVCALAVNQNFRLKYIDKYVIFYGCLVFPINSVWFLSQEESKIRYFSTVKQMVQ